MELLIRFARRHPPRIGWGVFLLGFVTVLLLPSLISNAELLLDSGPTLLAVTAGYLLTFLLGRRTRIVWIIPALLVPFFIFDLVPPWRIIEADARALILSWRRPATYVLPASLEAAWQSTSTTLLQAWNGSTQPLSWALARIIAVFSYPSAAFLALGLRRERPPLVYCLPFLATLIMTAMTASVRTIYVVFAIIVVLLLCIVGAFRTRQRMWDQKNYSFSDSLQWDVGLIGFAMLVVVIVFGILTPPVPYNPITTWLWTDVRLPAGLARLDKSEAAKNPQTGDRGGTARVGSTRPGENLELGRSLEAGGSEEVALRIKAPAVQPDSLPYWRGRIFSRYNGRGWETGPISSRTISPLDLLDPDLGFIEQEITDVQPGRQILYGVPNIVAATAQTTIESNAQGDTVGWIGEGTSYTVYSRPPAAPSTVGADLIEIQQTLSAYRTVPPELPQRVVDLANQLTADQRNQIDRATAIEMYLRGLQYSYEVAPLPLSGDAVDQFLFTMGQGYCTYYASAMAMMARAVGIPSRVVTGYATGEYDAATSTWTVHESDAHAWPELYIEGEGWTRWEPTPIREIPARLTTPNSPAPAPVTEAEPVTGNPTMNWALIALSLAILAAFIGVLFASRRKIPLSPARVLVELYRYGRRAGIPPHPGDSIEEYAERLGRTVPVVQNPAERVGRLLTARIYRQNPLNSEEEATLLRSWENARDMLPQQPAPPKQEPNTDTSTA